MKNYKTIYFPLSDSLRFCYPLKIYNFLNIFTSFISPNKRSAKSPTRFLLSAWTINRYSQFVNCTFTNREQQEGSLLYSTKNKWVTCHSYSRHSYPRLGIANAKQLFGHWMSVSICYTQWMMPNYSPPSPWRRYTIHTNPTRCTPVRS